MLKNRSIITGLFLYSLITGTDAGTWKLRLNNSHTTMKAALDGTIVLTCESGKRCSADLDSFLTPGDNYLQLYLENSSGGWSYHFKLLKDGVSVFSGRCGTPAYGCMGNQQLSGQVFETNVRIVK